jgi:hypothetical protein
LLSALRPRHHPGTAKCPEPLCPIVVLPPWGRHLVPPRRALPLLHHSYWLMRRTYALLPPLIASRAEGLRRLLPAPAAHRSFPTLSLPIFLHVSGPLLRLLPGCTHPFLPPGRWPSPRLNRVGASQFPNSYFRWAVDFGAVVILTVQTRKFARHSGSSHRPPVGVGQPWLLHPPLSRFVTSPCSGYANRPNPGYWR